MIEECPWTSIWVPNTFTPNGDENNNKWQPIFTDGFNPQDFSVIVINRWGETIWESHTVNENWDGTYKGSACPTGIYAYKITYNNNKVYGKNVLFGNIVLLR
jgi:gliding motility-associated-like protein